MKRPVFLIASLGLNLLLAGALVWAQGRTTAPVAPAAPLATVNSASAAVELSEVDAPATIQTNELAAAFHWSEVESADYRVYVANLRAIGCPEPRIRDIIEADVDALFNARVRDYVAPLQGRFWEFAAQARDIEKLMASHEPAIKQMEQEREEIFKALFNEAEPRRQWRNEQRETRNLARKSAHLDFLDETKRAAVLALEEALTTTGREIGRTEFTGTREEVERQKRAQQQAAKTATDQRLRELLSPEEYEEYRLRQSPGAGVRHQLARMTLSETEARRLAQAAVEKSEALAQLDAKNPATKSARTQLEQRTQDQIKELLGEARYAEYQRATDNRYNQTARVLERLQLPETTAVAVYQAQLEAEQLAARLRADATASTEERAAAMAVVRAETEQSVRQLLGAQAFQDYESHSGDWLERLARPAK